MAQIVSTEEVAKAADHLIEILEGDLKLKLAKGGGAERGAYTMWEIVEAIRQSSLTTDPTIRDQLRVGAGMHDLAAKVCAVWTSYAQHKEKLIPHLKMMAKADFIFQNEDNQRWTSSRGGKPKEHGDADKIIELYWACLCICAGFQSVALDDPDKSSKGKNPDVLARASDGLLWGFSAKTLAISEHVVKNLCGHIVKGVQQIEASEADRGAVVVNLKNVIDHEMVAAREPYETWQEVHAVLARQAAKIHSDLQAICRDELSTLLKNSKVAPVVVLVAHTSALTYPPKALRSSMTEVNAMFAKQLLAPSDADYPVGSRAAEAWSVCGRLNQVMQTLK